VAEEFAGTLNVATVVLLYAFFTVIVAGSLNVETTSAIGQWA
jgi:hypothetical protein